MWNIVIFLIPASVMLAKIPSSFSLWFAQPKPSHESPIVIHPLSHLDQHLELRHLIANYFVDGKSDSFSPSFFSNPPTQLTTHQPMHPANIKRHLQQTSCLRVPTNTNHFISNFVIIFVHKRPMFPNATPNCIKYPSKGPSITALDGGN